MKTLLQINIKPFTVPSTVSEQEKIRAPGPIPPAPMSGCTIKAPRSYDLSELPPLTLAELCTKFREQVFAVAGKDDPNMAPVYIPEELTQDEVDILLTEKNRAPIVLKPDPCLELKRTCNRLTKSLEYMLDNMGEPYCRETSDGFNEAREALVHASSLLV